MWNSADAADELSLSFHCVIFNPPQHRPDWQNWFLAPLVHHEQTVRTDSRGDRWSTNDSWTLDHTCFWPQVFTQRPRTHYDFPSSARSCFTIHEHGADTATDQCLPTSWRKRWGFTLNTSCGCVALWSIKKQKTYLQLFNRGVLPVWFMIIFHINYKSMLRDGMKSPGRN